MPETREARSDRRIDEVLEDLLEQRAPRHKLTKAEAQALIGGFFLKNGGGALGQASGRKQNKMCVMQVANVYNAVLNGETIEGGLTPAYQEVDQVDPVIEQYLIALNDSSKDEDRQKLLAYVPKLLNTKVSDKTERRAALTGKLAGQYAWEEWKKRGADYFDVVEEEDITKKEFMKAVSDCHEGSSALAEMVVDIRGFNEAAKVLDRLLRAR